MVRTQCENPLLEIEGDQEPAGFGQPMEHDGARNTVHPPAEPVKRRIDSAQDVSCQYRIGFNDSDDFVGVPSPLVELAHDLSEHGWQGDDLIDLLSLFECHA